MQRKKFHTNLTFHNFKHKYICKNMQLVNETHFLNETHLQKTIDFSILIDYIFYETIMILKSQESISLY